MERQQRIDRSYGCSENITRKRIVFLLGLPHFAPTVHSKVPCCYESNRRHWPMKPPKGQLPPNFKLLSVHSVIKLYLPVLELEPDIKRAMGRETSRTSCM